MANTFDHEDRNSWYFGSITRQEATNLLMSEKGGGVFLVRDSASILGDYVLCVKEDSKVSHYIINKLQEMDETKYRIGDQIFSDIPSLLSFYKLHYLDTTPLIRPASRREERVIAKFDFNGQDPDDLVFKRGEILTVITKDEDQWWTAKNSDGTRGSIPVPYVEKYDEDNSLLTDSSPKSSSGGAFPGFMSSAETLTKKGQVKRKLPALAKVKQVRIPNAYDKTALKLEIGDIITVTKTNINGQWEGELNGKIGYFPFTHVEFLDSDDC